MRRWEEMQVRAVVSDLDGTLLQPGGTLGGATRRAIRSLSDSGIPFLAATGRSLYGIRDTLESVREAVALGISSSGAIGYHPGRGEVLWRRLLAPAAAEQVVEALQRIAPGAGIAAFDGERWTVTQSYFEVRGMWPAGPVTIAPATGLAASACCALCVADLRLDSAALVGALAEAGVGPEVATITYAGPQLLDVVPASVDKGYGIRRACEPAQVLAFGDGPNDLALFRAVGLSVAVANADPSVLAAADLVAGSNREEGVASMLAELGLVTATAV
jgi:Cof subfamily protein (haloacid dehalogenase superfamily)